MVWIGRDLKDYLVPPPLPQTGTPFTGNTVVFWFWTRGRNFSVYNLQKTRYWL